MLLGIAYVDMKVAEAAPPAKKREKRSSRDYSGRSGFPRTAAEMRGIALKPSSPIARAPSLDTSASGSSPARNVMQADLTASSTHP